MAGKKKDEDFSLSTRVSPSLYFEVQRYRAGAYRDNSGALRYLLEVGLSACHHGFDEGLLKIKPINE